MAWQLVRRLLIFLVSAVVASMLVFLVLSGLGNPARTQLGTGATEEAVAQLSQEMGLDRPLVVQYWDWVTGILHGDFGVSYVQHIPIGPQISDRLLVTMWLVLGAMIIALLIAVPLGMASALWHGKVSGYLLSGLSQIGVAVPAFLAAFILVAIFSVSLGWLPANGYTVPAVDPGLFIEQMILPWLSLGLVQGAVLARYVRSAVLDEMGQDYLRTARSKGLTPGSALVRHGLRNAAIPVLTVIGVQLVTILVGAVVVERIFVIPGIGSYLADSVNRQDLLAVQGIVVTLVVIALLISFLVDVAYTLIDPRLRRR